MTEILPEILYGDPSNTVEYQRNQERKAKRDREGCRGCVHNSTAWGELVCEIDRRPHSGGWCKQWHQA